MIKHFFNFITSGHGLKEIEEPFGFKSAEFTIEQNEYYGRDINFAAGKNRLKINRIANHCLSEMLYNLNFYGFECVIEYIINVNGIEYNYQVDLLQHKTDGYNWLEFSLTELVKRFLLRRRMDVKSDLMSGKDLDGNTIGQIPYVQGFFPAKPIINVSKWNAPEEINVIGATAIKTPRANPFPPEITKSSTGVNPSFGTQSYDIQDSLSFVARQTVLNSNGIPNIESFTYIEARETLIDLTISLTNVNLTVSSNKNDLANDDIISAYGNSELIIRYGETLATSQKIIVHYKTFGEDTESYTFPTDYNIKIPKLERGHRIWIYLANDVDVEFTDDNRLASYVIVNNFKSMDVEIVATSKAYNTVVPFIRVIDAIKYVVKSSSGLDVYSPVFDVGGRLYNQYVTTSSLMRLLYDKPVNLSFKEILEGWLPEFNAGYYIDSQDRVVVQLYDEFYRNYSLGVFNQAPTKEYSSGTNDAYLINQFNYKWSNFASQKENEERNTYDIVHGETEWLNGNKSAMNAKAVEIRTIRDAFYQEQMRRKSYDYSETSATQDDDKFVINELVPMSEEFRQQRETSDLRHSVRDGFLELFNNGSFSWVQLGIERNDYFEISEGANQGIWIVSMVDKGVLTLISTGKIPQNAIVSSTTYLYQISEMVTLKVRTNEGFAYIDNIQNGDNFANLAYTPKRNILNYWQSWLATSVLYAQDKSFKNTVFKNNPEVITQLIGGAIITEGEPFTPEGALLEPIEDEVYLEMDFDEFMSVSLGSQDKNGFIGYYNAEGQLIKIYVSNATWQMQGMDCEGGYYGIAKITGERKYDPVLLYIFGSGNGSIVLNSDKGANDFHYEIDEYGKLSIFDEVGELMHPPVYYNRVTVNNKSKKTLVPKTPGELMKWLNNLK